MQMLNNMGTPAVIRRADYSAPAFLIDTVDLCFDLDPAKTRVLNKMTLRRNPEVAAQALRLDGDELNLARVMVNGQGTSFKMDGSQLVLEDGVEMVLWSIENAWGGEILVPKIPSYRITDVAAADGQPGMVRLTLAPTDSGTAEREPLTQAARQDQRVEQRLVQGSQR